MGLNVESGTAFFSDDRTYRYVLSRTWDAERPRLMFIGLNPSTADEHKLDPTLRRVIAFADREGCGGLDMLNLFALRATDPKVMLKHPAPVGPENDTWIIAMAAVTRDEGGTIIAGWGSHGSHRGRDAAVRELLQRHDLHCLGRTKGGHPKHPLYLRADTPLEVIA